MAKLKWHQSIVSRIRSMSWRIMLLLMVPVVISLTMMLVFAGRYAGSMERMGTIAALKPILSEEIPGAVWRVVSGRETLAESRTYELIDRVDKTIESITLETGENDRLELIIAGRTMDTLTQYVNQIRDNIAVGEKVTVNEMILSEVRDVAELVVSMLNDYITGEINSASAMSRRLSQIVVVTAAAEILLVLFTLLLTRGMTRSAAQFVREPIAKLESVTARLAEGDMSARLPVTNVQEL